MPRVYRLMLPDDRDLPVLGSRFCQLGVRPADITPDDKGNVHKGKKQGMSVSPAVSAMRRLVLHVPMEFAGELEGAAGDGRYAVFRMGQGDFADGPVTERIHLAVTSPDHGVYEPARMMALKEFEKALHATKGAWKKVKPDKR
jgi:hypothetical protein